MEPFLGEIRLFSFDWAPKGWLRCDGTLLAISTNSALFSLLGTQFGGDGRNTFALPDLRGRSPLGAQRSSDLRQGDSGGEAAHSLWIGEMPAHSHRASAIQQASQLTPADGLLASPGKPAFAATGSGGAAPMAAQAVTSVGTGQPHENRPPFLTLNFCIATAGIYPSRP